jgi:hypothetical protein
VLLEETQRRIVGLSLCWSGKRMASRKSVRFSIDLNQVHVFEVRTSLLRHRFRLVYLVMLPDFPKRGGCPTLTCTAIAGGFDFASRLRREQEDKAKSDRLCP